MDGDIETLDNKDQSSKQTVALVNGGVLVAGEKAQLSKIVESHLSIAEGDQLLLAQLAQDPIDVDCGKTDRIGQQVLVQRAGEVRLGA